MLARLHELDAITAGYVDKPGANLVVRLLEVCMVSPDEWPKIREHPPLRGVTDRALFKPLLEPGARSAVFALQSQSSKSYAGALALHFFYLNVGREGNSHLARVEVPAWVANDEAKLNSLHAVLIQQCQMMGSRPYPYLLHRAHETALVSLEEKEQVTQMIVLELHKRGIAVEERSYKQSSKDLVGRTRYRI